MKEECCDLLCQRLLKGPKVEEQKFCPGRESSIDRLQCVEEPFLLNGLAYRQTGDQPISIYIQMCGCACICVCMCYITCVYYVIIIRIAFMTSSYGPAPKLQIPPPKITDLGRAPPQPQKVSGEPCLLIYSLTR